MTDAKELRKLAQAAEAAFNDEFPRTLNTGRKELFAMLGPSGSSPRIVLELLDTIDLLTAERDKCGSGAGCLHKDALIDSLTAERDVLLAYYKATRAMTTTMGHPDATAEDERRTEAAYDKATNDVQRYQRESAAIAKEAK